MRWQGGLPRLQDNVCLEVRNLEAGILGHHGSLLPKFSKETACGSKAALPKMPRSSHSLF